MSLLAKVTAEYLSEHPRRRPPTFTDIELAMLAVFERESIRLIKYKPGFAEGGEPQRNVREIGFEE